eukprot:TRINITY_DN64620_c0_g1_i1.p1 TRINITY_DN64620_c0_g1~~TRINITY_DN64620_c0_g1_i1.p1  ORF type:complete len:562 (+),score=149.22 TRINITY_DN64620_c0_g1_i1:60-1745(+)
MAEFAIVPHAHNAGELVEQEIPEPIAEQNFNRNKMVELQKGISKLQTDTRRQHEVMSQLSTNMKTMISEADLRRAIGLAFQEFENRIEDAFQDSNRKCLQMFSKNETVEELQAGLAKKVSWAEYNAVVKKLSDLRQYIDSMAESVFIGQREALESEFSKKADSAYVEKALKAKADCTDVNDIRARLERLEIQVAHNEEKQSKSLEALRTEITTDLTERFEKMSTIMKEANATMSGSKQTFTDLRNRLDRTEHRLGGLDSSSEKLSKALRGLESLNESTVIPRLQSLEDRVSENESGGSERQDMIGSLERSTQDLREVVDQRFNDLGKQGEQIKEQLEFLMEATDMIKRRQKEMSKSTTGRFREMADDQDKYFQQLSAMERVIKKQERDVRAMETHTAKAITAQAAATDPGFMRAAHAALGGGQGTGKYRETFSGAIPQGGLPALEPQPDEAANMRLVGILDQLEKIAAGGPKMGSTMASWNPERPPLPASSAEGSMYSSTGYGTWGTGFSELPQLRDSAGFDAAPIDSARGNPSNIRGMYGLSPRAPMTSSSARSASKRKK